MSTRGADRRIRRNGLKKRELGRGRVLELAETTGLFADRVNGLWAVGRFCRQPPGPGTQHLVGCSPDPASHLGHRVPSFHHLDLLVEPRNRALMLALGFIPGGTAPDGEFTLEGGVFFRIALEDHGFKKFVRAMLDSTPENG